MLTPSDERDRSCFQFGNSIQLMCNSLLPSSGNRIDDTYATKWSGSWVVGLCCMRNDHFRLETDFLSSENGFYFPKLDCFDFLKLQTADSCKNFKITTRHFSWTNNEKGQRKQLLNKFYCIIYVFFLKKFNFYHMYKTNCTEQLDCKKCQLTKKKKILHLRNVLKCKNKKHNTTWARIKVYRYNLRMTLVQ